MPTLHVPQTSSNQLVQSSFLMSNALHPLMATLLSAEEYQIFGIAATPHTPVPLQKNLKMKRTRLITFKRLFSARYTAARG